MNKRGIVTILFTLILLLFISFSSGCKVGPVFELSNLTIEPSEVMLGDSVDVSIDVENTGDTEGIYTVTLQGYGVEKMTKEITLNAQDLETVSFVVTEGLGTHSVTINGLTGIFEVRPKLAIITQSLPELEVDVPCHYVLEATGGVPPYIWDWSLPHMWQGVWLYSTGVITGTPYFVGPTLPEPPRTIVVSITTQVNITVEDSQGNAISKEFDLTYTR